mgnify:CR=1 FL=1
MINTPVEESKGENLDDDEDEDEFEFDSEPGSDDDEDNFEKAPRMRADTFVGTVNYISPEVID